MTEFSLKRMRDALHSQQEDLKKGNRSDQRSHVRHRAFARVKFRGHVGEENLLKDISVTGCRVECSSLANMQLDTAYVLEVIPEAGAKIGRFELEAQAVWIYPAGYSGDVGFRITASPKGKLFQRYVDYLSWQEKRQTQDSSHPSP
jgi:hypothetical protein